MINKTLSIMKKNQGGTSTSSRLDAWNICWNLWWSHYLDVISWCKAKVCSILRKCLKGPQLEWIVLVAQFTESIAKLHVFLRVFKVYPVALRKESCELFDKFHILMYLQTLFMFFIIYYTIFYCIIRLPMSRQPFIQVSPPRVFNRKIQGTYATTKGGFTYVFLDICPGGDDLIQASFAKLGTTSAFIQM